MTKLRHHLADLFGEWWPCDSCWCVFASRVVVFLFYMYVVNPLLNFILYYWKDLWIVIGCMLYRSGNVPEFNNFALPSYVHYVLRVNRIYCRYIVGISCVVTVCKLLCWFVWNWQGAFELKIILLQVIKSFSKCHIRVHTVPTGDWNTVHLERKSAQRLCY